MEQIKFRESLRDFVSSSEGRSLLLNRIVLSTMSAMIYFLILLLIAGAGLSVHPGGPLLIYLLLGSVLLGICLSVWPKEISLDSTSLTANTLGDSDRRKLRISKPEGTVVVTFSKDFCYVNIFKTPNTRRQANDKMELVFKRTRGEQLLPALIEAQVSGVISLAIVNRDE